MVVAQINQQKTVREDGLSDPPEAGWKHPARARAFEQHQLDAGRHTPPLGTGRIAGRSRDGSAARRAALVLIAGDVRGGLDGAMILHMRRQPGCPLDLCTGPASCCLRRKGAGFVSATCDGFAFERSRPRRAMGDVCVPAAGDLGLGCRDGTEPYWSLLHSSAWRTIPVSISISHPWSGNRYPRLSRSRV